MTSKIKQVGSISRIDKLTTQIHLFLEQFFPPKIILREPIVPSARREEGSGKPEQGGRGRKGQESKKRILSRSPSI